MILVLKNPKNDKMNDIMKGMMRLHSQCAEVSMYRMCVGGESTTLWMKSSTTSQYTSTLWDPKKEDKTEGQFSF